jgi:hypothetical protein
MGAGKIIANIAAAIMIFFGVLFMWGAGSSSGGGWGWVFIGLVSVVIGFAIIFFANRKKAGAEGSQEVTYKLDLSGDINLDTLSCKSCGGSLSKDNISMLAGAPVVTCPYCNSSYQLTEEPKW